jgi:hypothetical protein
VRVGSHYRALGHLRETVRSVDWIGQHAE